KLSFVGSANLLDHVDAVNLTAEQQAALAGLRDETLRETSRDYMVNQQFRRDLFAKGVVRLDAAQARRRWRELRLALSVPRDQAQLETTGAMGKVTLNADIYNPVLDRLAAGPATVAELLADPAVSRLTLAQLQQVIVVLVG